MLETVMKYHIIFYLMGAAMAVGVIGKIVSCVSVKKLVKASSEIQKSNHRLMRLVKAKFEHASMVSDRVQNIDAFVQKYLYEYKALFTTLHAWIVLPIKMAWLTLTLGALGIVGCYSLYGMGEQSFRYVGVTLISVVFMMSIHTLSDEKRKMEVVKNYIVEYLENVCVHRYEKANQTVAEPLEVSMQKAVQEEMKETGQEAVQEVAQEMVQAVAQENMAEEVLSKEEMDNSKYRAEQEMRIRAILEEFLA